MNKQISTKVGIAVIVIVAVVFSLGVWKTGKRLEQLQSAQSTSTKIVPTAAKKTKDQSCLKSGGTVETALCCGQAKDFPNNCAIGACGCAPASSHQIKTCQCGEGKCFDGNSCVDSKLPLGQTTNSENQLADWKTYKNTKYDFELSYPDTWEIEIIDTGGSETFQLRVRKIGDRKLYEKTSNYIWVGYNPYFQIIIYPTSFTDVEKMIAKEKNDAATGIGAYADIVKTTSIDGIKAIWLANCIEGTNEQGPVMTKNGYRYELGLPLKCIATKGSDKREDPTLIAFYNEIDAQYKDVLNKIFTSFKFTN